METFTVIRGNTGPVLNVTAGPASEHPTGWTCRLAVIKSYGAAALVQSDFVATDGVAKCWLTHEETNSLEAGPYLLGIEMRNDTTTPVYRIEKIFELEILSQVVQPGG